MVLHRPIACRVWTSSNTKIKSVEPKWDEYNLEEICCSFRYSTEIDIVLGLLGNRFSAHNTGWCLYTNLVNLLYGKITWTRAYSIILVAHISCVLIMWRILKRMGQIQWLFNLQATRAAKKEHSIRPGVVYCLFHLVGVIMATKSIRNH